MARFLMIESWIGSAGAALPPTLHERGDRFVLLTRDPDRYVSVAHGAATLAEAIVVANTHDLAETRAAAATTARAEPFDGVLTTCDHYLEAVAVVAADLGLPGTPAGAVRLATRKDLVRDALGAAGLPNPRYATATTAHQARRAAREIGFPLIAKPLDLHSGTLVRRIDDGDQLAAWLDEAGAVTHNTRGQRRHPGVLLEQILTGPEISVETATHQGTTTVIGITDKSLTAPPGFIESGHQFPAPLDAGTADAAAALVRDALRAIGWTHGVAHTEVKLTPHGPRIVEINPRQGGNHIFDLVRLVTGRSTLDDLADLAAGRPPRPGAGGDHHGRVASAAIHFVMSPRDGRLFGITGTNAVRGDPHVHRWDLPADLPRDVRRPRDNEDYLGHVLAVDPVGPLARAHAERAVARLGLVLDTGDATPLGVELAGELPDPVAARS